MGRRAWGSGAAVAVTVVCLISFPACNPSRPSAPPRFTIQEQASPPRLPASVVRLAILFPRSSDASLVATYSKLEAEAFRLKAYRPALQIVDRTLLQTLLDEHHFHTSGAVSDDTAARLGRLLGADSILHYWVDRPTWRDHVWARFSGQLPPVRVFSKVIRVETGEVLFHHVVSVEVPALSGEATTAALEPLVRAAVDTGMDHTLLALQDAFR